MAAWRAANPRDPQEQAIYYSKRLEAQELVAGRPKPKQCEVCGSSSARIHFDHCHVSGRFRGWLCHQCNVALGMVRDSEWRLLALVDYLRRNDDTRQVAA